MEELFCPKDWNRIKKEDYLKYGINENANLPIICAWTFNNHFIELVKCDDNENFMQEVTIEYYGLISDKETQNQMGIEPRWLFQYKVEDVNVTLTVVQSITDNKIFSASVFFNKGGKNYGLNILCAKFPLKEFEYLTSPICLGVEELIKNI